MPKRAATSLRPTLAVAFLVAAFCGCATILGIDDVPAEGTGERPETPRSPGSDASTTSPDDPTLDAGACALVDAGNAPVLCGGDNVRCQDAGACCAADGSCVACGGRDPWSCESHEQCLSRPPFRDQSGPCCANLKIAEAAGLTCPRTTQVETAGTEPRAECIWVDSGVGNIVATCVGRMTLCRDDAECTAPAVCTKIRVEGTSVNGVVGACVAP